MKSTREFLTEQAARGGARVYPHHPIAVYTGSQRPRFEQRTPKKLISRFLDHQQVVSPSPRAPHPQL